MALRTHPEASLQQRAGEAFDQKHAIPRGAASVDPRRRPSCLMPDPGVAVMLAKTKPYLAAVSSMRAEVSVTRN